LITVFDHRYSTMSGSSFSFLCVNFLILQKWSNHPYSQNSSLSFLLLCLIFTCKFTFCVFILLNELFVLIILYSSILLFCYDEKVKLNNGWRDNYFLWSQSLITGTMSGSSVSFLCVNFLILQKWSNHPYSQNSLLKSDYWVCLNS
jgi:hypothetical protein